MSSNNVNKNSEQKEDSLQMGDKTDILSMTNDALFHTHNCDSIDVGPKVLNKYCPVLAIDIESVNAQPDDDLDAIYADLNGWLISAIAVAYLPEPESEIKTNVWLAESDGSQLSLTEKLREFLGNHNFNTLLTYYGSKLDYPLLRKYWDPTSKPFFENEFEEKHVDVFDKVKKRTGGYPSLDEALEMWEIESANVEAPETIDADELDGNVYLIGEKLLTGQESSKEVEAIKKYAENDVIPLVALFRELMLRYDPPNEK